MPHLTIRWDDSLLGTYERELTESDAEFIRDVLDAPPEQADPVTGAKARDAAKAADWTEAEKREAWGR